MEPGTEKQAEPRAADLIRETGFGALTDQSTPFSEAMGVSV